MRRNATGEERLCLVDDVDWHDASLYWWTDGNFGCDSNRVLVWTDWDARERVEDIAEMPGAADDTAHYCDTRHFTVIAAILGDGRRIPIDDDQPTTAH